MKYKKYRLCLLSLVILTVIGGFLYYWNMENAKAKEVDGTFVERFFDTGENLAMVGGLNYYECKW